MVHASTKHGPLEEREDKDFPVQEGLIKVNTEERGKQVLEGMGTEHTAEMLWRADIATGTTMLP